MNYSTGWSEQVLMLGTYWLAPDGTEHWLALRRLIPEGYVEISAPDVH